MKLSHDWSKPKAVFDEDVQAWLVTIAHRKAVDVLRANARRPVAVAEPPEPSRPAGAGDGPDDGLWDAVLALPERQRRAVAYHYLAGLPYAEIAALTGGTADVARRAAADGMKTLRRTYASSEGSRP